MDIIWFEKCSYKNKNLVGGKNASLGELKTLSKQLNFNIADGFAITVNLYEKFIKKSIDLNIIGTANITKVCSDFGIKLI